MTSDYFFEVVVPDDLPVVGVVCGLGLEPLFGWLLSAEVLGRRESPLMGCVFTNLVALLSLVIVDVFLVIHLFFATSSFPKLAYYEFFFLLI